MAIHIPQNEDDPWLIAIKESLEQHGCYAYLRTWAPGPSVCFFKERIEEDGIDILRGKSGFVFYSDDKWQIRLDDELRIVECFALEEIIEKIVEYLESPTMKERFDIKIDDPRLLEITGRIKQRGYWAKLTDWRGWAIFFAQSPPADDTGRLEFATDGFIYYDYVKQRWHVNLPIPQQDVNYDNCEECLSFVFNFLDTKDEMRERYELKNNDSQLAYIKESIEQRGCWAIIASQPIKPGTLPGPSVYVAQNPLPIDDTEAILNCAGRIYYNYYHDGWHFEWLNSSGGDRYSSIDKLIDSLFKFYPHLNRTE